MKYRKEVEEWLAVTISDECKYPYVFYDAIYEIECKVAHILNDMTDDELIDMFYQHSRGWPLEELEADIEWDLAQKTTTCIIRRLDRARLINVDQDKNLEENLTTVLAVYCRAQLSPAEIDELNPSESGDAKHVITRALEVLNDNIPEAEEYIPSGEVISIRYTGGYEVNSQLPPAKASGFPCANIMNTRQD